MNSGITLFNILCVHLHVMFNSDYGLIRRLTRRFKKEYMRSRNNGDNEGGLHQKAVFHTGEVSWPKFLFSLFPSDLFGSLSAFLVLETTISWEICCCDAQ